MFTLQIIVYLQIVYKNEFKILELFECRNSKLRESSKLELY